MQHLSVRKIVPEFVQWLNCAVVDMCLGVYAENCTDVFDNLLILGNANTKQNVVHSDIA